MLSADDAASLAVAQRTAVQTFMTRERAPANLVGFGVGVRYRRGEPTGEKAVLGLVERKVEPSELDKEDLLPKEYDVVEVGQIFAHVIAEPPPSAEVAAPVRDGRRAILEAPVVPQLGPGRLTRHMRPCQGGFSIGHYKITAGTLSTCVYDILPGASISPPRPGIGLPAQFYALSNNHVLANSNNAFIGDPILQPGPINGGSVPADVIAHLARYVPIQFSPPVPLFLQRNLVDCAIAAGDMQDLDREVYWTGEVRGWRLKAPRLGYPPAVGVGTVVQKTGMRTGWTTGRILATNATVDVNYGGGQVARFHEQFLTTAMSAPGDSGSLVQTWDNVAVGLLFAGSPFITVCNQIENVRALLRVEVAQLIL
jgi:hypothetical protein